MELAIYFAGAMINFWALSWGVKHFLGFSLSDAIGRSL